MGRGVRLEGALVADETWDGAADADRVGRSREPSCGDVVFSYFRFCSWVWMLSLASGGFWPLRTDWPRVGRSASGGGVGGKTLRLFGGSDCCLRDWMPGLTRLVAAYEMLSAGRSSLTSALTACKVKA
jgi:hypothetical protein